MPFLIRYKSLAYIYRLRDANEENAIDYTLNSNQNKCKYMTKHDKLLIPHSPCCGAVWSCQFMQDMRIVLFNCYKYFLFELNS